MSKRIPRPQSINMLFAIPCDVRKWLEKQSALNFAPMNSVVVATLRDAMDAERQEDAREGREMVG
jgi:hypothetical protein